MCCSVAVRWNAIQFAEHTCPMLNVHGSTRAHEVKTKEGNGSDNPFLIIIEGCNCQAQTSAILQSQIHSPTHAQTVYILAEKQSRIFFRLNAQQPLPQDAACPTTNRSRPSPLPERAIVYQSEVPSMLSSREQPYPRTSNNHD